MPILHSSPNRKSPVTDSCCPNTIRSANGADGRRLDIPQEDVGYREVLQGDENFSIVFLTNAFFETQQNK